MSQLTINTWFPVAIGQTHCPFINEVQSDYLKIISNIWYFKKTIKKWDFFQVLTNNHSLHNRLIIIIGQLFMEKM